MTADGDIADKGSPRHWLLVVALLLLYAYAFIDRIVLALLVDPIKQSLGMTDVQMGLLLGIGFSFFFSISFIPAGHFVDRYNRRAVIGAASVFWASMTIVCGTSTTLGQLFVGRAGVGIAEAFILPASFSLIRGSQNGSASPIWPTTILSLGKRSNTPALISLRIPSAPAFGVHFM